MQHERQGQGSEECWGPSLSVSFGVHMALCHCLRGHPGAAAMPGMERGCSRFLIHGSDCGQNVHICGYR